MGVMQDVRQTNTQALDPVRDIELDKNFRSLSPQMNTTYCQVLRRVVERERRGRQN